jgi:hypothetical protein
MFVVENARWRGRSHTAREEQRLRVPVSKRLQHLMPVKEFQIQFIKAKFMIESKVRFKIFVRKRLPGSRLERFGESA